MGEQTLGGLAESGSLTFGDGYRTKRPEHGATGFRILRVADVYDGNVRPVGGDFVREEFARAIGSKLSEPGDVLLTTKGTIGRVAIVPEEVEQLVYSPQLCYFRVRDGRVVNSRYLAYWFKSEAFVRQASHRANNTDMAAYISLRDLRSVRIDLPSIETQDAIADLLGALDDKIAANDRVIGAARTLAFRLMELVPGVTIVSDLAAQSTALIPPNKFDEVVAHFSLPAFDAGSRPEQAPAVSIKSAKLLLERPAVLVSKLNPRISRVWNVVCVPEMMAVTSTEFVVLEPKSVSTTALWAALSQPLAATALASKVAGTSGSHQRVRPAEILGLQVPDPRTLAPRVLKQIDALGRSVHELREQNQCLAITRDELLPLLMSGRVHVKEAARVVEEMV